MAWAQSMAALHDEEELIEARNATLQSRPSNVRGFFQARLKKKLKVEISNGAERSPAAVRALPDDEPYGS
jgi:hypothetical protein